MSTNNFDDELLFYVKKYLNKDHGYNAEKGLHYLFYDHGHSPEFLKYLLQCDCRNGYCEILNAIDYKTLVDLHKQGILTVDAKNIVPIDELLRIADDYDDNRHRKMATYIIKNMIYDRNDIIDTLKGIIFQQFDKDISYFNSCIHIIEEKLKELRQSVGFVPFKNDEVLPIFNALRETSNVNNIFNTNVSNILIRIFELSENDVQEIKSGITKNYIRYRSKSTAMLIE